MDRHALHEAAAAAFRLVSATNEFVAASQPWALAKDPAREAELNGVLYDAAEAVRIAAVLLQPVMPASAAEILRAGRRHRAGRRPAPERRRVARRRRPPDHQQPGPCGPASKTREHLS